MATKQNFEIEKGRSGTIVVTVTGVDDWTDILARFTASFTYLGTVLIELDGAIDESSNEVSFNYDYEDIVAITQRQLHYEVTLYKEDLSYIKNCTYGIITMRSVVDIDPTT